MKKNISGLLVGFLLIAAFIYGSSGISLSQSPKKGQNGSDGQTIPFDPTPTPVRTRISPFDPTPTPVRTRPPRLLRTPRPPKPLTPPPLPSLHAYSFQVITLDKKGKATEVSERQAEYFAEELGDGIQLEMIKIPAGTFQMGTADSEMEAVKANCLKYCENEERRAVVEAAVKTESPQHSAEMPEFYMGKYEVTQAQWRALMKPRKNRKDLDNPSKFNNDANKPVEQITWEEAVEFCKNLSQKTGRKYRLPSEAEWEYASRAGTATPFAFGGTVNTNLANYDGTYPYGELPKDTFSGGTRPVGWTQKGANGFGLHDMAGNVWEWCADYWHDDYQGAPKDAKVWTSENARNADRVMRGGSWSEPALNCRSASRRRGPKKSSHSTIGFRVVMEVAPVK